MKKLSHSIFGLAIVCNSVFYAQGNKVDHSDKMDWFGDAKLGIFIHWGIYSVNGIAESWAFFNNYISHPNYMKQLGGFTASKYQPEQWTKLIKNSGAKYAVITTRHHDGVSLWDSKADKAITTTQDAAAKKDVLSPFVKSLKTTGLKTGLYYSLPDWSHPNYDVETRLRKRYELKDQPEKWNNFVKYYQDQLREISVQYQPDLLWFDGDWEHNAEEWKSKETADLLKKYNPNIIINSRLNHYGDYETPEQGIPVLAPQSKYWELCYTMNDSWGYQPYDLHYKSPNMIVRTLADVVAMGGNLLIDIGPKEDGTLPQQQVDILKNLGRWTKKYSQSIYATQRGIGPEYFMGKSALSKNREKLFLYLEEKKNKVRLYGIDSKIISVTTADSEEIPVPFQQDSFGNAVLDVSKISFDQDATVLTVNFNESLKLKPNVELEKSDLQSVLQQNNSQDAVYSIAYKLNSGTNLFKNSGISVDGDVKHLSKFKNTNPITLDWVSKHAEVLYDTEKGMPSGHYSGLSALSKDKQTLYLFVDGKPNGPIALKGLKNSISRIRIVGEGTMLSHDIYNKLYWSPIPGIVYIDVPEDRLDKQMTVIAILLDKPLDLYRESHGALESNL
ncbi:alpha-L-fucosidase [Amniculibacterium sp. G2-70]|uniref:alpha-L-fucosidase n=1 Tax=Amniculibacterium sp. G2-70 TaxID=2767188 RepID=UPI0016544188|nr:alpha-L-fucosidase [Amniculibacterium sp. G2-70]